MFFKLIFDTFSTGLSKNTYYSRAVILSDIFEVTETFNNCFLINCEVSVGYLCKQLFNNVPSFKELTSCNKCHDIREKLFPTIQVKIDNLLNAEFPKTITKNFVLKTLSPKRYKI